MPILGYDWPRLHAALNDLPAALLFATVLFDFGAWITKRASLEGAAIWTLWAGVIGGWAAVLAGLQAEDAIEHGEAIHKIMEQHETSALVMMSAFTLVLAYKLFRRGNLSSVERLALRGVSLFGFIGIFFAASLGGKLAFEHAAGVPTETLEAEIKDRAQEHHHHEGAAADSAHHEDSAHHHDDHGHDSDHKH